MIHKKDLFPDFWDLRSCLLAIVLMMSGQESAAGTNADREENIQLALRRAADKLLRISGDSSSRIEIKRNTEEDHWEIHLNSGFSYDSLPPLLQNSLDLFQIRESYSVQVRRCDNDQIDLGYHQFDFLNQGTTPCAGRELTKECRYIRVNFNVPVLENWLLKPVYIMALSFLLLSGLGVYWLKRKKQILTHKTESSKAEDSIRLGSSTFYPKSQIVLYQNQSIKLSFREAKLLNFFALRPHQLLDRELILKEIWEDEGVMVGRSLDVFVSRLRKKLSADPSIRINAVHGIGYRLELKE